MRLVLEPRQPQSPRAHRRSFTRLRWLLLLIGVAALGYTGYVYLDTYVYQAYEDWSFDREMNGQSATVKGFIREHVPFISRDSKKPANGSAADNGEVEGREASAEASPPNNPVRRDGDPHMIGRIAIPRLGVRAVVREGTDDRTLRRAVGHVRETVRPGVPGNVGLAGHRDTFFRGLRNVRKNDRIVVETLNGTYEYLVESMRIVRPKDVYVLAPTSESVLTLVTCYPFNFVGNAPKRYIVRAKQVVPEPVRSASNPTPGDAPRGLD